MSFQKFSGGYPRTLTAEGGDPLSHHPTQPGLWSGAAPGVGTQTLVPLNFSAAVAPLCNEIVML